MGLYILREDVRVRLIGKVRFTDDENDENKMNYLLLDRLINEAEGDVEQDLSPRYLAPFQTTDNQPFKNLPPRPTKEIIRTLCELKAVMRVLGTDFGSGTVVDAEKYFKNLSDLYDKIVAKQLKKKGEEGSEYKGWMYPPLPGLALNYFNTEADDGYAGMVLSTSDGVGDYPSKQINNPAETFWNARVELGDNFGVKNN